MDDGSTSSLERAFQLAKSGKYSTVQEIGAQLVREGYGKTQIEGRHLTRQLRALIADAKGIDLPKGRR
jgi:hypothetical protein